MIEESRIYLLGAICVICGYVIKPTEFVRNSDIISHVREVQNPTVISHVRMLEKKDFAGVIIIPELVEMLLLCLKNLDDIAYNKKKDVEFVFKILKSKAYNEMWFQASLLSDKVEENMKGLDEFDF